MEVFASLLLNVGLLVIIAQLLTRLKAIKGFILHSEHTIKDYIIMIITFSMISILSNYTGYGVNGAIANTRIIGVMAGGFIGGPIVSIGVALIASIHRYAMDINGFASLACAISTLIGGLISALSSKKIKASKYEEPYLFIITAIAEVIQMLVILIFAKPFTEALILVRAIAIPMIIFNSLGMVLFISVFKNIIIEEEYETGNKVRMTFDITEKCLPLLKTELFNTENCEKIGNIVIEFSKYPAIIFTDTEKILSVSGNLSIPYNNKLKLRTSKSAYAP